MQRPGIDAMSTKSIIARALAPEDIKTGQYVSALYQIVEAPKFSCFEPSLGTFETAPVRWLPDDPAEILRVVEVCLPFVLVRNPYGYSHVIDVRRYRLARVPKSFGKAVFKAIQENIAVRKKMC